MPTLGERIREARTQRGLTQSELADQLVTPSMISQIESDRAKPSYQLLRGIAQRLGLDVSYFLSDMEDRHILTSHLKTAEYYLLVGDIEPASDILEMVERPGLPGENLHLYLRLMAMTLRHTGKFIDAVHLMEELRESAYRTQDTPLLIQVHQESGYIEYAMKNWKGAMMEWRNAVRLAEELLKTPTSRRVELAWDLTDAYLAMANLAVEQGDADGASRYLAEAQRLCATTSHLKSVADTYIVDANRLLNENLPSAARAAADKALAVMGAARQVERQIVIDSKLNASSVLDGGAIGLPPNENTWTYSAIHTSGADPQAFLETEVQFIETLVEQGELEEARERINQGKALLTSYVQELQSSPSWYEVYMTKLDICKADWKHASGDLQGAIECLQQVYDRGEDNPRVRTRRIFSKLLAWNAEIGDVGQIVHLTEQLQSWLEIGPAMANE